jgi:hypothetical protein
VLDRRRPDIANLAQASLRPIGEQMLERRGIRVRVRVGARGDLPDGLFCQIAVQPSLRKYFAFAVGQIISTSSPRPASIRGAYASSRTLVRDAVDAVATQDERRWCGRRSRVVLTPRRWRQVSRSNSRGDGGNKARSPGRARRKPLKPLRREGRVKPVNLW